MEKWKTILLVFAAFLCLCGCTKANSDEEFLSPARSDQISERKDRGDYSKKEDAPTEVKPTEAPEKTPGTEIAAVSVRSLEGSSPKTDDSVRVGISRNVEVPREFSLFQELKNGNMYSSEDSFLYIPFNVDEDTKTLVYYAGHYDTNVFQHAECIRYLETYNPNAVSLWFTYSGISTIDKREKRTSDLLTEIWGEENIKGSSILVVGSSNGGYVALAAAAYLKSELDVNTAMIVILDMGEGWGLFDWYFSQEDADKLLEMGTVVYHFGRNGGVRKAEGGKKFLSYGIPTAEVKCKNGDHDAITKYAFRNGLFSWMLNDGTKLNPDAYKIMYSSFETE